MSILVLVHFFTSYGFYILLYDFEKYSNKIYGLLFTRIYYTLTLTDTSTPANSFGNCHVRTLFSYDNEGYIQGGISPPPPPPFLSPVSFSPNLAVATQFFPPKCHLFGGFTIIDIFRRFIYYYKLELNVLPGAQNAVVNLYFLDGKIVL